MTEPAPRAARATTCLAIVRGIVPRERLDRLRSLYSPLFDDGVQLDVHPVPAGAATVVLVGERLAGRRPTAATIVWGCAVGANGSASNDEVSRALDDPEREASKLTGVFVLVGVEADRVRVVTSVSMPHTLRHVVGEHTEVWASRAVAAHVLAGRRPAIDRDVVAEQVLFDYVLGSDELIAGTRVCQEATVIDIGLDGARERSWWPRQARLAPAETPSTAGDLRAAVGTTAARFVPVPDCQLALTAGRDSRLVLDALHELGMHVPTVTMGHPDFPDVVGARQLAARAGTSHRVAPPRPARIDEALDRLVTWSVWTEGMEAPSNYLGGWPDLGTRGTVIITGHGGETGRAFHWKKASPDVLRAPADALFGGPWSEAPPAVLAAARHRAEAVVDELRQPGLSGTELLDRFYATNRMHSWVGRLLPDPQLADFLPAYLEVEVLRALLALPESVRRSGGAFSTPSAGGAARAARLRHKAERALRRVAGRPPPTAPSQEVQLIEELSDELAATSVVREVLGERWMRAARAGAPTDPKWRKMAWNAIGVDAAAIALRQAAW